MEPASSPATARRAWSILVGALAAAIDGVVDEDETSARILDAAYSCSPLGIRGPRLEDSRGAPGSRGSGLPAGGDQEERAGPTQVVRREIAATSTVPRRHQARMKTAADRVVLGFVRLAAQQLPPEPPDRRAGGAARKLAPSTIRTAGERWPPCQVRAGQLWRAGHAGNVAGM